MSDQILSAPVKRGVFGIVHQIHEIAVDELTEMTGGKVHHGCFFCCMVFLSIAIGVCFGSLSGFAWMGTGTKAT